MMFNIPQFLDTEDKIVGPLTAKQLGWLAAGSGILFLMWITLDMTTFYIWAIPVIGLACAFAFYRPYNQSLISFVLSSFYFAVRAKQYNWKRLPDEFKVHKAAPKKIQPVEKKTLDQAKIQEISALLDNQKN